MTLNGNMLSDGTNAFTWNARNQVAALNSVSLQYDAAVRRTKNAAGTSFYITALMLYRSFLAPLRLPI